MGSTKFAYGVVVAAASSARWAGDVVGGRLEPVGIASTIGMQCGNSDLWRRVVVGQASWVVAMVAGVV